MVTKNFIGESIEGTDPKQNYWLSSNFITNTVIFRAMGLNTTKLSLTFGEKTMEYPDFTIDQGAQWLIIGPSGSGKTSLLNMLTGLQKPSSGAITYDGQNINEWNSRKLDDWRATQVGLVLQRPTFISALNTEENIKLPMYLSNNSDQTYFDKLTNRLNLQELIKKKIQVLSEGEKQRAAIARALIAQPSLIFADEPSSALDDLRTEQMIQLLLEEAKNINASLIVVTHDHRIMPYFSNVLKLEA